MKTKTLLSLCSILLTLGLSAQNHNNSNEAYLGVTFNHVSEEKAQTLNFKNTQGAYVSRITEGSAAQTSGIKPFDYIVGINNKEFTKSMSFDDLMDKLKPGETAQIQVIRGGEKQTISADLTNVPNNAKKMYEDNNAFLGVYPSHKKIPENIKGTRISYVVKGTTAKAIGMRADDIILTINKNPILDWIDVGTALNNTPTGEKIEVVFY